MNTGRTTMYRGIKMRSRLEADYARWLDEHDFHWQYEPRCFADETGQYLPDFVVESPGGSASGLIYVEIKPASFPGNAAPDLRRRMAIIWSSEPDSSLNLVVWDLIAHRAVASWHSFHQRAQWSYWTPAHGIVEVA